MLKEYEEPKALITSFVPVQKISKLALSNNLLEIGDHGEDEEDFENLFL